MIIVSKLKSRGFSLVELAVSLAIIGMIVSSALSVAITNDASVKQSETERKLNIIEEALAGFLLLNQRLPCPANGQTAISDATFGQEGDMSTGANGGLVCPNRNFTSATGDTDVHAGVVPVDTLQLPDDFMFDGWGRRITYAVDYKFANNDATNLTCLNGSTNCFIGASANNATIEVQDASGTARTIRAVYILISHGENGHGAYTKNGGANRLNGFPAGNPYRDATASAHELENAEFSNAGADTAYDDVFVMRRPIRVDDKSADPDDRFYFDDIVRYKEKHLLAKEAGSVLYDEICNTAQSIVDSPGSNRCTGVNGEEDCESFAVEVYERCLK